MLLVATVILGSSYVLFNFAYRPWNSSSDGTAMEVLSASIYKPHRVTKPSTWNLMTFAYFQLTPLTAATLLTSSNNLAADMTHLNANKSIQSI